MKIGDLMTTTVITVGPESALKDAAAILAKSRVSGLPVVDARGAVIGVLSEGDIVYRESGGAADEHRFGSRRVPSVQVDSKLASTTVGGLMSSPAVTIAPRCPVTEAAQTMIGKRVNRLPVVDDAGQLVGIVTRSDLLRAFVRSDDEVAAEIREDVLHKQLWLEAEHVRVDVDRGRVRLTGLGETQTDAEWIPILVQRVPGVVSVVSGLSWLDQNGRLDGRPDGPSPDAPSRRSPAVAVAAFLESEGPTILAAAGAALTRKRMPHYSSDGDEAASQRLSTLFDQLLSGLNARDLGPIVAHAERVAEERFSAGYDLSEVQVAFNALEEATWSCVLAELDSSEVAEAIGLISTALGTGKDALARRYVSLATNTHVPSLDVRALFRGNPEGVPAGQERAAPYVRDTRSLPKNGRRRPDPGPSKRKENQ